MEILRGYKYRLRPTKKQIKKLIRWTGACRFVFNCALEHRELSYRQYGRSVGYYEQQNSLPEIKKEEGFEWLKEVPSQSLQMALRNLDKAFQNFFKGTGAYPKAKKKGKCTDSIAFPQGNRIKITPINKNSSKVDLPKIGLIKFRDHRDIIGEIRSATISKDGSDWHISFCVKEDVEARERPLSLSPIGLDKGITHTIINSSGYFFDLPVEQIKGLEKRIECLQRKLAKEKKFSKRWQYYSRIISKLHKKITRKRYDFLHKLSCDMAKNHSLIAVENLKVKNMSSSASGTIENPGKNVAQKSGLNRSILRQGWGIFQNMLDYKAGWFGTHIEKVCPKNTSITCSNCHIVSKKNRKSQNDFLCISCGHQENADINAAKNILRLGLESLGLAPQEAPTIIAQAI